MELSRFIKLARFSPTLDRLAIVRLQLQIEVVLPAAEFFAFMSAKSALPIQGLLRAARVVTATDSIKYCV